MTLLLAKGTAIITSHHPLNIPSLLSTHCLSLSACRARAPCLTLQQVHGPDELHSESKRWGWGWGSGTQLTGRLPNSPLSATVSINDAPRARAIVAHPLVTPRKERLLNSTPCERVCVLGEGSGRAGH